MTDTTRPDYLAMARGEIADLEPKRGLVAAVPDDYEPGAGEVLVEGEPAGMVWEAGAARPRTAAEDLEEAKAAKVEDFARRGVDELADLFTPGVGRDEMALLMAAHVLKVCEALKIPPDPRLAAVVKMGEKALQKKAEVEAAETAEELEAVEWT